MTLERLFKPRRVAVVGASPNPSKLGSYVLASLRAGGYEGELIPINPAGGEIQGLTAYASLADVPGELDLVASVVPAAATPAVLREAAAKGAAGAVVLSAGFREAGRADLEAELVAIVRETGLRILGPNIQGLSYLPAKLCACFWPVLSQPGRLAVVGQSGSMTAALAEWADEEGLGVSALVNLGNQADLCASDVIEFLADDGQSRAVALYLEGVAEGRRLFETIAAVAERLPVAVMKSGSSPAGRRATASHTASLAGEHRVFAGACRQYRASRAETLEGLYDAAKALACMRPPAGRRLAVLSSSGGIAAAVADACAREGLEMPSLPPELVERLRKAGVSPQASFANPLDLASPFIEEFPRPVEVLDEAGVADTILLVFGDPVPGAAEAAIALEARTKTPLAVAYLGGGEEERRARRVLLRAGVACYPSPERAVAGIAAAAIRAASLRARMVEGGAA